MEKLGSGGLNPNQLEVLRRRLPDKKSTICMKFILRMSGVDRELTETGSHWLTQAGLTAAILSGS